MAHERARTVHRQGLENRIVRLCACVYEWEGEIRRKTNGRKKKAHHPNARDWRSSTRLPLSTCLSCTLSLSLSLPPRPAFSYFTRYPETRTNIAYRFVAPRSLYFAFLSLHLHYSLFWENFRKIPERFSTQLLPHSPYLRRFTFSHHDSPERGFEFACSESRSREGTSRTRAAKLDRKGRHKTLGYSPVSFSRPYRAMPFQNMRPPKIVATHTGYETFTSSPPLLPPS